MSLSLELSGNISLNTRQSAFYRRKAGPATVVWADRRSWWVKGDNCSVTKTTGILSWFWVSPLLSTVSGIKLLLLDGSTGWPGFCMVSNIPSLCVFPAMHTEVTTSCPLFSWFHLCSTFQETLRHFARAIFLLSQSLRACGLISTILVSLVGFREREERNKAVGHVKAKVSLIF